MRPLRSTASEVWRFQRDQIYPDVVTGITRDRKRWVFVTAKSDPKAHQGWVKRFGKRTTIYCRAIVGPSVHRPSVTVVAEVDGW